jgi:outer membrane protein with beta-barrel domain
LTGKKMLVASGLFAALASVAGAQSFGIGASLGWANDVGNDFAFRHSDVNGWIDYRIEEHALLRFTYGSMRTQQSGGATIDVPVGDTSETRELKERVHYYTLGVSYLFSEGFFTSGLFAGLGGYQIRPDVSPSGTVGPDVRESAFGWHVGSEAIFRVVRNLGLVGRATYHNVSAHPHRQFLTLNAGVVARF